MFKMSSSIHVNFTILDISYKLYFVILRALLYTNSVCNGIWMLLFLYFYVLWSYLINFNRIFLLKFETE